MKKNLHLLFWIVFIDALYLISFVLPVFDMGHPHLGWEIFVDTTVGLFRPRHTQDVLEGLLYWSCNPLLWVGVVCLWARRPHFALLAGGIATGLATFILYDVKYLSWPLDDHWHTLWTRSGAYLWSASMLSLATAGLIFTIKQWRQTGHLPMIGE